MDYEKLLTSCGEDGLFQIVVFIALAYACFNSGVEISTMVIALHQPSSVCVKLSTANFSNTTTFARAGIDLFNATVFSSNQYCKVPFPDSVNLTLPCKQWSYDIREIGSTLVTEFGLICEKTSYQDHVYTAFFLGQVIGMALNSIGDIIGRRKFILICCLWETLLNLGIALIPGFIPQLLLRFFRSFSCAIFVQSIGLLAELITVKRRGMYLNTYWLFWCIGTMMGAVFAYIGYDWRTIKLIATAPSVIYISYFWVIPESPRWLMLKGKREEAEKVLKTMARWNKVPWDGKILDSFVIKAEPTGRIKDLFSYPNTRRKTLVMSFVQWSFCLCYYGLTSDPGLFSKNIYLGLFFQGLVELPTSLFAVVLSRYLGRKPPCLALIALTTVFLIAVPFIKNAGYAIPATIVAMSGKLFMVTGFIIIDCINSELHPTSVRAMGLTVTNFIGNTGNILAAYINRLSDIAYFLPPLIYGVQVAVCGVLIFAFIPEMAHCPLPQTVDESEKLYAFKENEWIHMMRSNALHEVELIEPLNSKASNKAEEVN